MACMKKTWFYLLCALTLRTPARFKFIVNFDNPSLVLLETTIGSLKTDCAVIIMQYFIMMNYLVCYVSAVGYQPKSDTAASLSDKRSAQCSGGVECSSSNSLSATDNSYLYTAPLYCSLLGKRRVSPHTIYSCSESHTQNSKLLPTELVEKQFA